MKRVLTRLAGLVLGLGVCLLPAYALAAISLPFSTTYNCAEQNQLLPGWVTCDGITPGGGWSTSLGSVEQITSGANYPGGGGGRGQRHMIGNSTGNTNGSGGVQYSFTAVHQEVFIRFYVRWQAGMKQGGTSLPIDKEQKIIYFAGGACGQSGGCYFAIHPGSLRFVVSGTPYDGTWGWDNIMGGAASDGQWRCMEVRLKNETSGSANDGIVQWWVDGTLRLNQTGIDMKGSTGFGGFNLPSNHQFTTLNPALDMFQDIDDVAISKTGRIGCIATTPPVAPQSLQLTP